MVARCLGERGVGRVLNGYRVLQGDENMLELVAVVHNIGNVLKFIEL